MASSNPYRYAGNRYDSETGMYYLMARYYSPNLGRFISRDAIDTNNLYAYCGNNPVNLVDPAGYVEMEIREAVNEAGGIIKWNKKTGVATATIGGKTKTYNIRNCRVKNNRIMIDSSKIAKDFGMNVYAVEGRRTLAQTRAYLKSDQAKTAYRQTALAVVNVHVPIPYSFIIDTSTGDSNFDRAITNTSRAMLISPSTGMQVYDFISVLKGFR